MGIAASCETWSGAVTDGDDLTLRISNELGISDLTILSVTVQADRQILLELSPPDGKPNRVKLMGADNSYVGYISNATEGVGVNVIRRIIARGDCYITLNFWYWGQRL